MQHTSRPRRLSLRIAAIAALLSFAAGASAGDVAPSRALPADVQADVEAIAEQLAQVSDTETALACSKAVDNARYGVETMLEVGEKNLRDGYLTPSAYDAMAPALRSLLGVLSVQDCESASGPRRDFYQCMSSDYNHVLACGKAHPFEP
ncbi:hypothetical protein [Pseudoxanthomonas sp. PXM01]|uniref:hypothetical protein n=1 Tax=Pseudoxanthomonas sp. PXM01 TaxID=2769295 RepID=UPI00178644CE|nr:hypothetical protein [Pseudoxanthomonas sp. PXM01]MBD9470181.1 hypothetical protein [Pseudoxanthomonas sp. PXM01]